MGPRRDNEQRCNWCAAPLRPVEVHGHVQCGTCGINIEPCCGGEQACPALKTD